MGIMLVYDITNEKTFENIVKWLRNIDEVCAMEQSIDTHLRIIHQTDSLSMINILPTACK